MCADRLRGLIQPRLVAAGDRDAGAGRHQRLRDAPADSRAATGDERCCIGEIHVGGFYCIERRIRCRQSSRSGDSRREPRPPAKYPRRRRHKPARFGHTLGACRADPRSVG